MRVKKQLSVCAVSSLHASAAGRKRQWPDLHQPTAVAYCHPCHTAVFCTKSSSFAARTLNIQELLHTASNHQFAKSRPRTVVSVAKVSEQCADMQEPHVSSDL